MRRWRDLDLASSWKYIWWNNLMMQISRYIIHNLHGLLLDSRDLDHRDLCSGRELEDNVYYLLDDHLWVEPTYINIPIFVDENKMMLMFVGVWCLQRSNYSISEMRRWVVWLPHPAITRPGNVTTSQPGAGVRAPELAHTPKYTTWLIKVNWYIYRNYTGPIGRLGHI